MPGSSALGEAPALFAREVAKLRSPLIALRRELRITAEV